MYGQMDMFTRVLKGHIAIDRSVFPAGTPGINSNSYLLKSVLYYADFYILIQCTDTNYYYRNNSLDL